MTFISYAQNFEDVMLWRALKHVENGFYIDIGAQDPVVDSVSLAFYEHGWRGIHVEPVLDYVNQLALARPDEIVIPVAVGSSGGLLTFFTFPDTGLSTVDSVIAQRHKNNGFRCVETTVPVVSLDEILEKNSSRQVHWLKLDVEGAEKDALKSWKKSNIRPWILVIESTFPLTQEQSHQEWEQLVLRHGYTFVYFDGLNRYYVSAEHPELKPAFMTGPNFFDDFKLSPGSGYYTTNDNNSTQKTLPESQLYRCAIKIESLSHDLSERDSNIETLTNNIREREEQLELLSKELSERDSNVELLAEDARVRIVEIEQLTQKITGLVEQVNISKQSAHHWWLEYDKLRMELEPFKDALTAVHGSRSWRMTAPLRAMKTVLVHKIWRNTKVRLKITLNKLAVYVNRHPILRRMALRIIHRTPRTRLWLTKIIGQASAQPVQKNILSKAGQEIVMGQEEMDIKKYHKNNISVNVEYLTARAQRVHKALKMELMNRYGEKH